MPQPQGSSYIDSVLARLDEAAPDTNAPAAPSGGALGALPQTTLPVPDYSGALGGAGGNMYASFLPPPAASSITGAIATGFQNMDNRLAETYGHAEEALGYVFNDPGMSERGRERAAEAGYSRRPYAVQGLQNIRNVHDVGEFLGGQMAEESVNMGLVLLASGAGFAVGGPLGAAAAGAATSWILNSADNFSALVEDGVDPNEAAVAAGLIGVPQAALDTVLPARMASRILGTSAWRTGERAAADALRRAGGEAGDLTAEAAARGAIRNRARASYLTRTAQDAGTEAITESAQEGLQMLGSSYLADTPLLSEENFWQAANAAVIGGALGGAGGAITNLFPQGGPGTDTDTEIAPSEGTPGTELTGPTTPPLLPGPNALPTYEGPTGVVQEPTSTGALAGLIPVNTPFGAAEQPGQTTPPSLPIITPPPATTGQPTGAGPTVELEEQPAAIPPGMNRVVPAKENIADVGSANFKYWRAGGDIEVNLNDIQSVPASDKARVEKLAGEIASPEGFFERIIVDQDNNVIEGRHRADALRELGVENVPVTVIEDTSSGYEVGAMEEAAKGAGLRGDQVTQIVGHALDAIAENGSPAAAFAETEMPAQYQSAYEAALRAALPAGAEGAVPGTETEAEPEGEPSTPQKLTSDEFRKALAEGDSVEHDGKTFTVMDMTDDGLGFMGEASGPDGVRTVFDTGTPLTREQVIEELASGEEFVAVEQEPETPAGPEPETPAEPDSEDAIIRLETVFADIEEEVGQNKGGSPEYNAAVLARADEIRRLIAEARANGATEENSAIDVYEASLKEAEAGPDTEATEEDGEESAPEGEDAAAEFADLESTTKKDLKGFIERLRNRRKGIKDESEIAQAVNDFLDGMLPSKVFNWPLAKEATTGVQVAMKHASTRLVSFTEYAGEKYGGSRGGFEPVSFKKAIIGHAKGELNDGAENPLAFLEDLAEKYTDAAVEFLERYNGVANLAEAREATKKLIDDTDAYSMAKVSEEAGKEAKALAKKLSPLATYGTYWQVYRAIQDVKNDNVDFETFEDPRKRPGISIHELKRGKERKDYRKGRNIGLEELTSTFGLEGVEQGSSISQKDLQAHANHAYDAFMDLAETLGVSPKMIGLEKTLTLAFAFSGDLTPRASAHYLPAVTTINLTREKGDGSLAHEWLHALEDFLAKTKGRHIFDDARKVVQRNMDPEYYINVMIATILGGRVILGGFRGRSNLDAAKAYQRNFTRYSDFPQKGDRISGRQAWRQGFKIGYTNFLQAALDHHKKKVPQGDNKTYYWQQPVELIARSFESYIYDQINAEKEGVESPYLVNGLVADGFATKDNGYKLDAYPREDERAVFSEMWSHVFENISVDDSGNISVKDKSEYDSFYDILVQRVHDALQAIDLDAKYKRSSKNFGTYGRPNKDGLSSAFYDMMKEDPKALSGDRRVLYREANQLIKEHTQTRALRDQKPIVGNTPAGKVVEEAYEAALVRWVRGIVRDPNSDNAYETLVEHYKTQPALTSRTGNSSLMQAFSTPAPLAYAAQRLARISDSKYVLEPAAGHGMLVTGANPARTHVNELDPDRANVLGGTFRKVKVQDATTLDIDESFDVVITNPPFSSVMDDTTKKNKVFQFGPLNGQMIDTTQVDHAIVSKALEHMKDDGRAVILIAAPRTNETTAEARQKAYLEQSKPRRVFFKWLYENFNVEDQFTVDGELYAKQGAKWPVDVVVINGRGASELPTPTQKAPRFLRTWDEIKETFSGTRNGMGTYESQSSLGDQGEAGGKGGRSGDGGLSGTSGSSSGGSGGGRSGGSGAPAGAGEQGGAGGGNTGAGGGTVSPDEPDTGDTGNDGLGAGNEGVGTGQSGQGPSGGPETEATPEGLGGTGPRIEVDDELQSLIDGLNKALDESDDTQYSARPTGGAPDPKVLANGVKVGKALLARGIRDFNKWARAMIQLVGERIARYLRGIYISLTNDSSVKGSELAKGMTPATEVTEAAVNVAVTQETKGLHEESQVPYKPASEGGQSLNTKIPSGLFDATNNALERIKNQVGNIDEFVANRLGYKTDGELYNYFSGEQIDAIALAITNLDKGAALVLGDQTGIGKGRVVAAMLRYAKLNDIVPIFVTEKPNLYRDMFRDLSDITPEREGRDIETYEMRDDGEWHKTTKKFTPYRILMSNANEKVPLLLDPDEKSIIDLKTPGSAEHVKVLEAQAANGLQDYDVVFTTYSQLQPLGKKRNKRRNAVGNLARDSFLVLDESHNAAGQGTVANPDADSESLSRAHFIRRMVQGARSVMYSSATWAKTPDVMDLYAATDMRFALGDIANLVSLTKRGGVPLQQILSSVLAKAGQYIRRERDFEGIEYQGKEVEVDQESYASVRHALRDVFDWDSEVTHPYFKDVIRPQILEQAASAGSRNNLSPNHNTFSSLMHNIINQMLLTAKADAAADRAIAAIKRGERPIITVANTMGSFIEQYAQENNLAVGDAMNLRFNDILKRYLNRTRRYTVRDANDVVHEHWMTLDELEAHSRGAKARYEAAEKMIDSLDLSSLYVSPIDHMHRRLREAGIKSSEITGRQHTMTYDGDKIPTYSRRGDKELNIFGRIQTIEGFNNGDIQVLIINQAGATGLSLHAHKDFKNNERRRMIIAQAEQNIDVHMQMLGRINRTGQITIAPDGAPEHLSYGLPIYEQLIANVPAERRPAGVLLKKMASLNASTTADAESETTAKEVKDVFNRVGDQAALEVARSEEEVHRLLGSPLEASLEDETAPEGSINKFTGRVILLEPEEQDRMWGLINEQFDMLMQQAAAAGESPLRMEALPLDAKTLYRQEVVPAGVVDSPFAEPAFAEHVDIEKLVKPPTTGDVDALIKKNEGTSSEAINTAREEFKEYRRRVLDETDKKRLEQVRSEMTKALDDWESLVGTMYVGAGIVLRAPSENFNGVVVDITRHGTTKNPLALSAWRVKVALVTGNADYMTQPLSKITTPSATDPGQKLVVESRMNFSVSGDRIPMIEAFDKIGRSRREQRWIMTGNILKAYEYVDGKGAIITFTDNEGNRRQGIRMAADFDLEKHDKNAPLFINADQAEILGDWLTDDRSREMNFHALEGDVVIQVNLRRANVVVKKTGNAAIWGDAKLRDLFRGKDMAETTIDRKKHMVGELGYNREGLKDAILRINELVGGGLSVEGRFKGKAKEVLGLNKPSDQQLAASGLATPLYKIEQQEIANEVHRIIDEIAARDVTLEVKEQIFASNAEALAASGATPTEGAQEVAGSFSRQKGVIEVSLNTESFDPLNTAHHEAFHTLENLLTKEEVRVAYEEAKKAYPNMSPREAVASHFADWATKKPGKFLPAVRRGFRKIMDFLKRVGNLLRGRGFRTSSDIFTEAKEGRLRERAKPEAAPWADIERETGFKVNPSLALKAVADDNRTFSERMRESFTGPKADPRSKVVKPGSAKDVTFIERWLGTPGAVFKKYAPKIYEVQQLGVRLMNRMSNHVNRLEARYSRAMKGLTPEQKDEVTSVLFAGDNIERVFTDEELAQGWAMVDGERHWMSGTAGKRLSAPAVETYKRVRRLLDEVGRYIDKHEIKMKPMYRKARDAFRRQLQSASSLAPEEFNKLMDRALVIHSKLRRADYATASNESPESLNKEVQEIQSKMFGMIDLNSTEGERILDAYTGLLSIEAKLQATSVRRRKGYVPHKFFGNFAVYQVIEEEVTNENGETEMKETYKLIPGYSSPTFFERAGGEKVQVQGFWNNEEAAIRASNDFLAKNPDARTVVMPVAPTFATKTATTLPDLSYYKLLRNYAEASGITQFEARSELEGVAKMRGRRKFAGFKQFRKGVEGYSEDLDKVIGTHIRESVRYVALDELKYAAVVAIEQSGLSPLKAPSSQRQKVLAEMVNAWLRDVMGEKQPLENSIDELFQKPWARPLNTAMAMGTASFLLTGGVVGSPVVGLLAASYVGYRFYSSLSQNPVNPTRQVTGAFLNDMAHLKLGAFLNVFSPLVNLSQIILTTYPVLGSKWTMEGLKRFSEAVTYGRDAEKVPAEKRTRAHRDFLLIQRANINTAFRHSDDTPNVFEKQGKIAKWSMALFQNVETMNRGTTYLGAYARAEANGSSVGASMKEAQGVVDRTQFDYSNASKPEILRNTLARLPLQFKNFIAQMASFMLGMNWKGAEGLRFMTSVMLMAGVLGFPGLDLLDWLIKVIFGEENSPIMAINRATLEAQASGDLAGGMMQFLARGMPSLVGMDLSTRVGVGERFFPTSPRELTGPWISTLSSAAALGRLNAGWVDQLRNVSTGAAAPFRLGEALFSGGPVVINNPWKRGRMEMELTPYEAITRAVGGSPLRVASSQDFYEIARVEGGAYQRRSNRYIDRIVRAINSGNSDEVADILERARNDNIQISGSQIRYALEQARRPRLQRVVDQASRARRAELARLARGINGD